MGTANALILAYNDITTSGLLFHAASLNTLIVSKRCDFIEEMLGIDYPYYYKDFESFINCVSSISSLADNQYENCVDKYYTPLKNNDVNYSFYDR